MFVSPRWSSSRRQFGSVSAATRPKMQEGLKKKPVLDEFTGHRMRLINRKRAGLRGWGDQPPGGRRKTPKTVVVEKGYTTKHVPPPPDAVLWKDYKEKFGDCRKAMKSRGHSCEVVEGGQKVVLMPKPVGTPGARCF